MPSCKSWLQILTGLQFYKHDYKLQICFFREAWRQDGEEALVPAMHQSWSVARRSYGHYVFTAPAHKPGVSQGSLARLCRTILLFFSLGISSTLRSYEGKYSWNSHQAALKVPNPGLPQCSIWATALLSITHSNEQCSVRKVLHAQAPEEG